MKLLLCTWVVHGETRKYLTRAGAAVLSVKERSEVGPEEIITTSQKEKGSHNTEWLDTV